MQIHSHSSPNPNAVAAQGKTAEHSPSPSLEKEIPDFIPKGHKGDGIETKRHNVLQNLHLIRQHLSGLKHDNWSPSTNESRLDGLLLSTMIKAESTRNPALKLADLGDDFSELETVDFSKTNNFIAELPDVAHTITGDIRETTSGQKSIIIFDPLHHDSEYAKYDGDMLKELLPEDAKVSVVCMDLQKSNYGCKIFSLSTASKLTQAKPYMDALHALHLHKDSETFSQKSGAQHVKEVNGINVFTLPKSAPASFLKHAESRSSLAKASLNQRQQLVNKAGETLQSRQQGKLVERAKVDPENNSLRSLTFSASIEDKRMTYLNRTIDYLSNAPQETVEELLVNIDNLRQESLMPDQLGRGREDYDVGPKDELAERLEHPSKKSRRF